MGWTFIHGMTRADLIRDCTATCVTRNEGGVEGGMAGEISKLGADELVAMLLEAIDCLGCSEEGIESERELSRRFAEMIGDHAASDRGARLLSLLSDRASVGTGVAR